MRELILDVGQTEVRAALMEDGIFCEMHTEKQTDIKQTESLFMGRVEQIRPSVGSAFVDIGLEQNAFLPIEPGEKLRCGELILVQGAAKQATEGKGLRISRKINLPGKWLVLLPGQSGVHISKKVKDPQQRQTLAEICEAICPADCGLIMRTASEDVDTELLREEAVTLHSTWQEIERKAAGTLKPGLIWTPEGLAMRLVRDLRGLDRIVTNDSASHARLCKAKEDRIIDEQTSVEYYKEENQLLFDLYGVESQIDKALRRRVWLPCGGYLVIDRCEAMTVIDVNSGKMVLGRDIEDTALRVNTEAVSEIARQLRLRNTGGMVIADFIDMMKAEHREQIVSVMKQAVSSDRAEVRVLGMTKLGLLEMTRKRKGDELSRVLQTGCTMCSGDGLVLSNEENANRAMRQLKRLLLAGQRGPFVIRCAPQVAQILGGMNAPNGAAVYAIGEKGRHPQHPEIVQTGEGEPMPKGAVKLNNMTI